MRTPILLLGIVLTLGVPTAMIVSKERLIARGNPVYLELAPVDPRSLMQGDYMRLEYSIARELWRTSGSDEEGTSKYPRDGRIVISLDSRRVAHLVRRHAGEPLQAGEYLLRYRHRSSHPRIGPDAYFFQEGDASLYEKARYGEVRVDASGDAVLMRLRDEALNPLGRDFR